MPIRNSSIEQLTIPYLSRRLGFMPTQVYEIIAEIYNSDQITFDIFVIDENESHPMDRAQVEPHVSFLTVVAEESYNRYCNRFFYRNGKKKFAGFSEMEPSY